jgi:hypothetical protein
VVTHTSKQDTVHLYFTECMSDLQSERLHRPPPVRCRPTAVALPRDSGH